jgi:hypothetical protein
MAQVLPDALRVDFGYTSTPLTPLASITWTDVTSSVMLDAGVTFNRGRSGIDTMARPGSLSFTLDNSVQKGTEGRFTLGGTNQVAGLALRIPVRVRARFPFAGPYVDLWYGYVEALETGWDNGWRSTVRVSATDRLARLEKRKLPGLIRGVQLVDAPSALWPCDDSEGSTAAGEQSSNPSVTALSTASVGAVGTATLTFGEEKLGPGPDGQSCAVLTTSSTTAGYYLTGSGLPDAFTDTQTLEVYFQAAVAGSAIRGLVVVHDSSFNTIVTLKLSATDKLVATTTDAANSLTATVTGTTTAVAGVWNHALVKQTRVGDTVTVRLFLNGSSQGTPDTYSTASSSATIITGASISAGALRAVSTGTATGLFYGRLANIGVYPTALSATRITEHARVRDTLASYTAETSAAKFTRLAEVAGLSATEYGFSYGSPATTSADMAPFPVGDRSLLDAANEVAIAEASAVYLDRSGVLRLASRNKRYGTAVVFTVTATAIDKGTGFSTDMGAVVNDVTVSRPGGITARSVDAASVAAYDTHDSTTTVYLSSDSQAVDMAAFLANLNSEPVPRISGISVDLVSSASLVDEATILTAEVGDRFQVTGLPSASTPAATLDLIVDGMTDTVTATSWRRAFICTQIDAGSTVWVLDDATYSVLNSTTVLAF